MISNTATANTRTSHRFSIELDVELGSGGAWVKGRTRNISLGGMFVETRLPLQDGARVMLRFRLHGQKDPIQTGALVRWHGPTGGGLQFDGLRARDIYALGKFLEPHPHG